VDKTYITELDEKQLDELLTYVPDYSPRNADNIREMFLQKTAVKRKPKMRGLLAAAVVVIMITLSITALAATGVIDFGRFYNTIFSNPEALPFITEDDIITSSEDSSELTIEPVAVFADGWQIYIQLKVTVLNGVPLPDTIYLFDGNTWINYGETTVSRLDEASAVISFMTLGNHVTFIKDGSPVFYHTPEWEQADTVTFKIDAVSSSPFRNAESGVYVSGSPEEEEFVFYSGQWEFSVPIDKETVNRIDPGFIETVYEGLYATASIHATSFEVRLYSNENTPFEIKDYGIGTDVVNYTFYDDNGLPEPSFVEKTGDVVITLADGRTVEPRISSTSNDDMLACYTYTMGFINPEDVVSVMFFGVELIK